MSGLLQPVAVVMAASLAMGAPGSLPAPAPPAPPAVRLDRAAALQHLSGELGRLTQAPPAFVARASRLNEALSHSLKKGSARKAALLFASDAILMPSSGEIAMGRTEIETYWRDLMATGAVDLRLTMASSSTTGRLGHQAGSYELVVRGSGGASVDRGEFMSVMRRGEDGRWQTIYAVFNSLR